MAAALAERALLSTWSPKMTSARSETLRPSTILLLRKCPWTLLIWSETPRLFPLLTFPFSFPSNPHPLCNPHKPSTVTFWGQDFFVIQYNMLATCRWAVRVRQFSLDAHLTNVVQFFWTVPSISKKDYLQGLFACYGINVNALTGIMVQRHCFWVVI